jgi:CheY-like chemotaxis protein
MKLLIVEDDPSLGEILVELVQGEIPDAEILEADNLDDAVAIICSPEPRVPNPESRVPNPESRPPSPEPRAAVAAILTDGTFPTWPRALSRFRTVDELNGPRPNWIGLAGWAEKKHIPIVVLTGAGEVFEHARRVGVPVFMKPLETHRAIACLRALVVPKALRENPVVAEVDLENEELKRRKWEVGNRK